MVDPFAGRRELCSLLPYLLSQLLLIVVFFVRQERSDVDVPLSLVFRHRFSIVDQGYKSVPVVHSRKARNLLQNLLPSSFGASARVDAIVATTPRSAPLFEISKGYLR